MEVEIENLVIKVSLMAEGQPVNPPGPLATPAEQDQLMALYMERLMENLNQLY